MYHSASARQMRTDTVCSADVTAEVAGTQRHSSFTDTAGNATSGNLTFDNGQLYLRDDKAAEPVSSVYPNVKVVL